MAMSIGVIVPGVSSTIILMLLGVYHQYLYSVANVDISFLIPLIIGLSFGSLICMIIIKKLLDKFYAQTFYSIIGFTLGSIFILFPGINDFLSNIISILCIILGIQIIHIFPSKKENS
jgi:putative membrane protein